MEAVKGEHQDWRAKFAAWQKADPELATQFEAARDAASIDESTLAAVRAAGTDGAAATRAHSGKVIQKIAELLPEFVGGSADLHPSTSTYMPAYPAVEPRRSSSGRNFHFGIREHGMGSLLNGIALYGGLLPFGATFFVFTDYMRPPIRLASIMELGRHLRLHPRQHLRGRGRTDAPADRAPGRPARHPGRGGAAPGRRRGDRRWPGRRRSSGARRRRRWC